MPIILECRKVSKNFGGLVALKQVDCHVNRGEILGLIGPNGAGKTTLFNVIGGVYRPDAGMIKFKGENIVDLKPHNICRKGIARTHQLARPFPKMTVLENVYTGALFRKAGERSSNNAKELAIKLLEDVGLSEKKNFLGESLNVCDRKILELARALATKPELLMLDEIMAALNPVETERLMAFIRKIRDEGVTIFMIEHVVRVIIDISDRILVLNYGEKIAEGRPKEISRNKDVIQAYLGEDYA